MREIFFGMLGSMALYLVLPDVELTKMQTILILIVGCMLCTAAIWLIQEKVEQYKEMRRRKDFHALIETITLKGERRCG